MYEDFLREKRYLLNVSEAILTWYEQALHWLPNPNPDEREVNRVVIRMRENGLKASSINSYRTALNSYLHWTTGTKKAVWPSVFTSSHSEDERCWLTPDAALTNC